MYSFLHPYRRTTSIYRWTIGLPSVPTVPMDKVFGGLPYALAIMLTTSFTKGFCTFTDRVFISPSVPMDNWLPSVPTVPMDKVFGATLCPCNNANYLIHEGILHIYRSCIHFSIRTDGQLRFTDGQLVYHRYRPYRWTRFLGATLCPCNNANYLIHERILCAHLPIVYSFLHPYRRTTSIYRWKIGLPSVPTVPMDKVFGGYLMPLQ